MGSIVHRSVPTNLKWFPNCSHAHALFQDRFKDVQVGSRWFSTLYILSPNFHISPQRGGFSWALCLHDYFRDSMFCVTGAALENPVRPSERLKRGWILLFDASTWSSGKVEADGAKHTLPCG